MLFNVKSDPSVLLKKDDSAIFAVDTKASTRSGALAKVPAAFIAIEKFNGKPYISWLVTFKDYQGQGLAKGLIGMLKEHYSTLTLHEDSTNERLKQFYINQGFKVIGSRMVPDDSGGELKQLYMEWTNSSPRRSRSRSPRRSLGRPRSRSPFS
jgi:ribosomal protein S18 acetylase RimI-like enzyme